MNSLNIDVTSFSHHERGLCGGGGGWSLVSLHHPWQVAVPLSTPMVNMMQIWVMMLMTKVVNDEDDEDDDIADGKEDIADDDDYDCVFSGTTTPPSPSPAQKARPRIRRCHYLCKFKSDDDDDF